MIQYTQYNQEQGVHVDQKDGMEKTWLWTAVEGAGVWPDGFKVETKAQMIELEVSIEHISRAHA